MCRDGFVCVISHTGQIPKSSLKAQPCPAHHCHHQSLARCRHRWVISKYFPKGSPEQIQNSLLKTVTVLKTTSSQEQLNHLTELEQDSIPIPGTKYVLNKYLLTKDLVGRAGWEELKACVRPEEVRLRCEECVIGIDKRDPSWGIRRRRIYYYFYCYCLLWAELCPPHPIHMLTS